MMRGDADRPSEAAIGRELMELALLRFGREAAHGLEQHIAEAASAIALIAAEPLGTWSDEPDFLVAAERQEG
jgi:hypothetical protein